MRPLSAADTMDVWEAARDQDSAHRAYLLLRVGCPDVDAGELLALTVAERDRRLFALRTLLFGPVLEGYAECPRCGEEVVFDLDSPSIPSAPPAREALVLEESGVGIRFRLPTTEDLMVAARAGTIEAATALICERCVMEATRGDEPLDASVLPDGVVGRIADAMLQAEPQAEILLDLSCPSCEWGWQTVLDIASFLWSEIRAQARRLLREVDALARAYGWNEAEILALSESRRQHYLTLIMQ